MFQRFANGVAIGMGIGLVISVVDHFLLVSDRARLIETMKRQKEKMRC